MTCFIFGDSVANGYGVDSPASWSARVNYRTGWTMSNHGINASLVGDQVTEITGTTITSGDQVIWLAGYNDMRADTSLASFQSDFETGLAYISARTAHIFVCGALKMTAAGYAVGNPTYDKGDDAGVAAINAVIVASCGTYSASYVDVNNYYIPTGNVQGDNVHPNSWGDWLISRAFLSIIPGGDKSAAGVEEFTSVLTTSGSVDQPNWSHQYAIDGSTATMWAQWASVNEWLKLEWLMSMTISAVRLRIGSPDSTWGTVRFTYSDTTYEDVSPDLTIASPDQTYTLASPKDTTSLKIGCSNATGQSTFVGFIEVNITGSETPPLVTAHISGTGIQIIG